MRPIETRESDFVYLGPTDDIGDLPCKREQVDGGTAIYSVWEPTQQERAAILDGANIRLGIYYVEPIPPVSVAITHLSEVVEDAEAR